MIKEATPVIEVKPGDLIIANTRARMRVTSTLTILNRATVIIYGSCGSEEFGIPHGIADEVTRLV